MKKTKLSKIAFKLALSLSLGFASVVHAELPAGQQGGTLNVGLEADFPSFDVLKMGALAERQVAMSFYETLLEIDESGKIIPNLVESFNVSPDATSFQLKLRGGIKFHDGTPFDAAAVVENLKRLTNPTNACRCAADIASLKIIEASGPMEVRLQTDQPAAHLLAVLADTPGMMASPTAMKKLGGEYGMQPVGTGPFIFKEWKKGNYLHVVRNTDYWKKGKPLLNEVFYRPVTDEQTRVASLEAGNLDVALVPNPRDVAESLQSKKFKVINAGSLGTNFVMFNTKNGPTADRRIRIALAHATDRVLLNKAINRGVYKVANTPFGSGLAAHEEVDAYPEFDLSKAKKIITEIGTPVKIELSIQATPSSLQTAQALQQMWKRANVEVNVKQVEQVQHIREAIDNQFEAKTFRWPGRADPDMNVFQFFHSSSSRNYTRFKNAEMDKLLTDARATTDPVKRTQLYRDVSNLLAKEVPYLFLNYYSSYIMTSQRIHGVKKVPDGLLRVDSIWKQ